MSLTRYNQKRDFTRTAEPKGKSGRKNSHRFVIQKHAASHLHYDFRLELDGTLKSWAIPKGVPYQKGEKRLAMEVEDHPVSYIHFEGTIPKGQYGGGTVMVWDLGTYEPISENPSKELKNGKLHFRLHGNKLEGEWYLVRLRDGKSWLLVKGGSNQKRPSARGDDSSAITGRSMEEIGAGKKPNGERKTPPKKKPPQASQTKTISRSFPKFISPMKAQLVDQPPPGDWVYEIKFDGFRALTFINNRSVTLLSRNQKDFSEKFPQIYQATKKLRVDDAVLDGEIVALDEKGRSSFQLLQAYDIGTEKPPMLYYVFDLLRLNGSDMTRRPLSERKELLKKLLKKPPPLLRFSESLTGDVHTLLKEATRLGLEGLIGKKVDSSYEPGSRNGSWIKLKLHNEQEMVIGGFTEPEGTRSHFGSLLLGYYENKKLICAGKVGTGFNQALLSSLSKKFKPLLTEDCPFSNLPEKKAGRYGAGITVAEMRRCHWLEPKLICQVKYSEWTRDGKLRHPVFLGLREDKKPRAVVREKAR